MAFEELACRRGQSSSNRDANHASVKLCPGWTAIGSQRRADSSLGIVKSQLSFPVSSRSTMAYVRKQRALLINSLVSASAILRSVMSTQTPTICQCERLTRVMYALSENQAVSPLGRQHRNSWL